MIASETLTITIADDNKDHAQSLASLVHLWGYDAHTFLDIDSALEFCEMHSPDVLMLDIGFPLRSIGLTAARNARRALQSAGTRLVAITGFDDDETRSLANEAGFEEYFV